MQQQNLKILVLAKQVPDTRNVNGQNIGYQP